MKKLTFITSLLFLLLSCNSEKEMLEASPDNSFIDDPEVMHYVIVQADSEADIIKEKDALRGFNKGNGFENLRLSSIYLKLESQKDQSVIVVRRFANFNEAEKYVSSFSKENDEKALAVSQHNYRLILREKKWKNYEKYYEEKLKG